MSWLNQKNMKNLDKKYMRNALDATLTDKLGDYISSQEAYHAGVNAQLLVKWRKTGVIKAVQIKKIWYYSRHEISVALKTASEQKA